MNRSTPRRWSGRSLTLRYANLALDVGTLGPTDVRQRISQNVLRSGIHADFHFATVKAGGCAGRCLFQKPHVDELGRSGFDLARLAEGVPQSAHRLTDVLRRNAR